MHKKDQGSLGEHIVITQCLQHQISVFKDVGDNARFDLVLHVGNELLKVQVKCYTRRDGATWLAFRKDGPNYSFHYSSEDVDWFAVVDLETFKTAWIWYADFPDKKVRDFTSSSACRKRYEESLVL